VPLKRGEEIFSLEKRRRKGVSASRHCRRIFASLGLERTFQFSKMLLKTNSKSNDFLLVAKLLEWVF
jgi:hypothetical protein